MENIGKLAVGILSLILTAFVLTYLWGWFIVPLGVKALSIPHAVGISAIVTYLVQRPGGKPVSFGDAVMSRLGMSAAGLLIGYVAHLMM